MTNTRMIRAFKRIVIAVDEHSGKAATKEEDCLAQSRKAAKKRKEENSKRTFPEAFNRDTRM
jgi:hypothetical protein